MFFEKSADRMVEGCAPRLSGALGKGKDGDELEVCPCTGLGEQPHICTAAPRSFAQDQSTIAQLGVREMGS